MAATATSNELELLYHRRLMHDDGRGMSEGNNDETSLSFRMMLAYETPRTESWVDIHKISHELNHPLFAFSSTHTEALANKFTPLAGELDTNLQVISLKPKDYASDDVVVRVHNLNHLKPVTFYFAHLFHPESHVIDLIRQKSLNLVFDIPFGSNVHRLRRPWKTGDPIKFSFVDDVAKTASDAQNTNEEGVFLSDEALRLAGRKPLSLETGNSIQVPPSKILSFVVSLKSKEAVDAMLTLKGGALVLVQTEQNAVTIQEPTDEPQLPPLPDDDPEPPTKPTQTELATPKDPIWYKVTIPPGTFTIPLEEEEEMEESVWDNFSIVLFLLMALIVGVIFYMLSKTKKGKGHTIELPLTVAADYYENVNKDM